MSFGKDSRSWAKHKTQDLLHDTDAGRMVRTIVCDDSSTSRPATGSTSNRPSTSTANPSTSVIGPTYASEPSYDPVSCAWNVPGAGAFKNKKVFTFFSQDLPSGLSASNYQVFDTHRGAPYNHTFDPANVHSDGDFLNLRVPGGQEPLKEPGISSAEVVTVEKNILYASVRTNAILDTEPGTCVGMFFYKDDNQEADIEYLSDPKSRATAEFSAIPLWYVNQALSPDADATHSTGPAPWDVTAVHEYRIDWTPEFTAFYLDGILQKRYTTNVPTEPGCWIWNNWANGDIEWSVGPPLRDNTFKIQNITMYYNTKDDSQCCS